MANKPQKELGGTRNMSLGTKIVVGIFAVIMALSMMLPSLIPIFGGAGEQEEQADVEEATEEAAETEATEEDAGGEATEEDAEAEGSEGENAEGSEGEATEEGSEDKDADAEDAESADADEDAVPDNESLKSLAEQYKDEVAKYEERLAKDPKNLAALLNLGQNYMNWGYSALYSSSTDDEKAYSNDLINKAQGYFESYQKLNASDAVTVQQALCEYYLGNTDAAIDAMKKLSEDKPDYPLAWANLGLFYEWQYNYDEATKAYLKAVEIDPDDEYGAKTYAEQRMASINSSRSSFEDLTNESVIGTNATPQEGLPGIIANNMKS